MTLADRLEGLATLIAIVILIAALAIHRALQITKSERTHRRKMKKMIADANAAILRTKDTPDNGKT